MKKSSLQIILVVVIVGIIAGMLLVTMTNAYWVQEMKVVMELDDRETCNKKITITTVKGEKATVNFRATIDCQSHLDIIEIDKDENIFLIFSSDTPSDSRNGDVCEIRKSFTITPEETTENYDVIFLSPGIDNYGKDQTISELLKYWQSLEHKTLEMIINTIRSNTVGISGSNDLMTVRKIKVRTEEPQMDIDWTIRNGRLEIYGTTNLPEDTIIEWRFVDPSIRTEGCTEVNWNRRIRFTINNINAKEIRGNLILEKDGKFIAEETIIWPKYQKTITPTTEKSIPLPVSNSFSPEILKPSLPPTTIPGIKEPKTPGMSGIASIFAIITAATIIIKRKK